MKKTRSLAVLTALITAMGLGITGCEWETSGSDDSWSDSYNWVNFSGVYKNPNGGSVVTDFTRIVSSNDVSEIVSVPRRVIATGNGGSVYSGTLGVNVVPGSLIITAGGQVLTDNGSGQLTADLGTVFGSISYGAGEWSINLGGLTVVAGQSITATFSYFLSTSVNSGGSNSGKHGSTGTSILSFTVMQEGNRLTLIDSDGMRYEGKMGSLRSASGELGAAPKNGDTVIGQYSVKGSSRVGLPVEIIGVLQGFIVLNDENFVMTVRTLQGQWIEKVAGGKVGDVVGKANDVRIMSITETDVTFDDDTP